MHRPKHRSSLFVEFAAPENTVKRDVHRTGPFPVFSGSTGGECYHTVESGHLAELPSGSRTALTKTVAGLLSEYLADAGRILVCGLGSEALTADALGSRVCRSLSLSGPLPGGRSLFSFVPGVSAVTGIPTGRLVRAAAECVQAKRILIVDALCACSAARLSSVIQISSAGLTPGSGTGEAQTDREEISSRTMPCPVVSLGIPTVIRTTLPDGGDREYLVTESCADRVVEEGSRILASAVIRAMLR